MTDAIQSGAVRPINRVRDVVMIGKRRAVLTRVAITKDPETRGTPHGYTGWQLDARWLDGRSKVAGRVGAETYTTSTAPLPILGSYQGLMIEGSVGAIVPSDGPGRNPATETTTKSEEDTMAGKTVTVKRSGSTKASGTTAAKKSGGATATATKKNSSSTGTKTPAARKPNAKVEKIKKEVSAIAGRLSKGGKMKAEKERYGVSDDGPIRVALYHAGFDSKGAKLPESRTAQITGSGASLAKKLVKERTAGVPLYELAARTGKSEGEVKAIIAEAGGPTTRVYTQGASRGR